MLIVLTDVLACPRCGPEFGLVVRADRLRDRRVLEGGLGCPNCREVYPIAAGLADLRYPPGPPGRAEPARARAGPRREEALRMAALLGVASGPGLLLLGGDAAALAAQVAAIVPEVGTVGVAGAALDQRDEPGTSRVLASGRLPVRSLAVQGVALTGRAAADWLDEGRRVLARGGRIVLEPAPPDAVDRLRAGGCEILLDQDRTVVASASAHG